MPRKRFEYSDLDEYLPIHLRGEMAVVADPDACDDEPDDDMPDTVPETRPFGARTREREEERAAGEN